MLDRAEFWMRRALIEASRGLGQVEPNPMVGAVVVRDDELISVGHHARFGGPHAEIVALNRAGERARGSTLFVTLEPCCHFGKTPPCTGAVLESGIGRVVVAMDDPFPKVAGGGIKRLRDAGLEVQVGLLADEARQLNAAYLKQVLTARPFVTAKWAMTLDGRLATSSGSSQWISGQTSRAHVHELRGRMDVIVTGVGTVLADNPRLTARPPGPRLAARLILDSSARTPIDSQLVATAPDAPTWVAVTARAATERVESLRARGCEILAFPDDGLVPIGGLLDELGRRALTNLMIEGGGRVLGAFFDADAVDAVSVFIAPILAGGPSTHVPFLGRGVEPMNLARRLASSEVMMLDGDIHVRGSFVHDWLPSAPG